jgi:tight adherence protein B
VDTTTIAIAGIAAVAILLIAVGISMSGSGSSVNARLERYAASKPDAAAEAAAAAGQQSLAAAIQSSQALTQLNKVVEQRDFGANLAREIARADLRLKVSEYLVIWVGTTIGLPLLMLVLSPVMPTLGNPLILLFGAFLGFMLPRFWLNRRKSSRVNAFNKQLPDTITLIANALRAGSSFLQAIELVVRESPPPASTEFGRVIREVNLGLSFDVALENMVRRVKSEDLELMATAISIQHTVGGNLAEILDSIAFTIRERVRIKGEIRTLTAQQRMSGYVVGFLPIALAAFLFVAAPQFMEPMFDARAAVMGLPIGILILGLGGFMMFLGFMIIRRIVDIEV